MLDKYRGKSGSSDYNNSSPKMRAILSKVVNEDLKHVMPSIKCPTLLVWGKNDTATPLRDAEIMEKLIPLGNFWNNLILKEKFNIHL